MKMKNGEIVINLNNLSKLVEKRLPQKISYAMTKNNIVLANEYEIYAKELEKLNKEYDAYIIKDKDGKTELTPSGIPKVKPEMEQEYYDKINELLNIETEVNLYKIDEECFNYDDTESRYDSLSVAEQMILRPLLVKMD